jgi:alginate O-acetyltransferase complex protein AlgI
VLFNSLQFAIFFPTVTAAYFLCPRSVRWVLLLVASYAFYMAWRWEYGVLLATMSLVDWYVALRIEGAATATSRLRWLWITILGNFGMLSVFKYWNLFNGTAADAAQVAGLRWPIPAMAIFLPVGISFHTFQTVGYAVDVYRGKLPAERNPLRFALFVSFFPQLVAGPIERATRLLPQLQRPTDFDRERLVSGLRLAGWGMFKKVVVADRLAVLVNEVYGSPEEFHGFGLVLATVFFGMQVYCDFSGYSDIAIGTARVLGFDLMTNFDHPYGARSMTELWSRWHISLSTWFRDYLYLPLGGSRVSFARWAFNVTLVFFVSGIWHGAEWRFALWGLMHGFLLIADRATLPLRDRRSPPRSCCSCGR